jgi:CRP/FNR family transcriptional regulator, cyclic AMP receptor protein
MTPSVISHKVSNFAQTGRRDRAKRKVETDGSPKAGARRFDPATFLATAAKGRAISTHRKGATFFAQGDATDAIFYIKKGKVKITVVSKQGKEAVVALLSADEFFSEGCLIGQPKRSAWQQLPR